MRLGLARLAALAACLLGSGCVALGGIDRETGTIDKEVGTARNTSILLNIVRASQGEPLYFYSLNQVGGSGLEDFKLSLPPLTLGPRQTAAQRNYTLGTNGLNVLDSQVSGNFNVAVLDSKNFYAGMLAPLDLVEVNILLKQGFPRELVYRLVVQDVTVYWAPQVEDQSSQDPPMGRLDRFVNDPAGSPENYAGFNRFLAAAMSHGITVEEYQVLSAAADAAPGPNPAKSAPPTTTTEGRLCSDLALVAPPSDGAGDTLKASAPTPYSDVMDTGNACGARPLVQAAKLTDDQGASDLRTTFEDCWKARWRKRQVAAGGTAAAPDPKTDGAAGKNRVCAEMDGKIVAVQLNTRSLYGIFRYLGAAVKNQSDIKLNSAGAPAEPHADGQLIHVVTGRTEGCFASAELRGRYCVPLEDSENLKETFSMINALQALKTSPGDLPFTPTVRIEQ